MRKKMLSWLFVGILCINSKPCQIQVKAEPAGEVQLYEKPESYYLQNKGEPSEYGYQEYEWIDENGEVISEEDLHQDSNPAWDEIVESVSFPSSYDMRNVDGTNYVPEVRSQGSFGTCWAHAALASIETNMIKQNYADTNVNYAERHLAYFAHTKNAAFGDGADSVDSSYGKYGGGNAQQAMGQLAGWFGAANEEDFPYSGCSKTDTIEESSRNVSVAHLTEVSELLDASDIKKAIMENGAVQGSYYSSSTDGEYVFRKGITGTNHAISIIGWDDSIDKSNFSYSGSTPTANGAWLCRNSWGTTWGNAGYFWISYEDSSLSSFWSFEAEPAELRDYIYQYDGAGYNMIVSGGNLKAANAYTAVSDHILQEVGFYTNQADTYQIDIYLDEEGTYVSGSTTYYTMPDNPEVTISGQVEYGGYHTVDLPQDIWVTKGQRILVVLGTGSGQILFESGTNYSISKNQSYLLAGTLGTKLLWKDCVNYTGSTGGYGNVCLKIIADEASSSIARALKKSELQMSFSAEEIDTQKTLESKLPETVSVITDVDAGTEAEASVIWKTEDSFVATGGEYKYTGTLQSDDNVYIPDGFATVSLSVVVEPVTISNPVFEDVSILLQENKTAAGVKDFSEEIFPVTGEVTVGKNSKVTYSLQWNQEQTIDLSDVNASVEFTGSISYTNAAAWMTLPKNLTVTRKISVQEPPFYQITLPGGVGYTAVSAEGYQAEKVYEGRNYSFWLQAADGYDLSSVSVKVNGTEYIPTEGSYTIENVTQNITDITVANVQLKNTLYKAERTKDNQLSITPIAPATGIRFAEDTEYQTNLIYDGTEDVKIVLRDAYGMESAEATVPALGELVLTECLTKIPAEQSIPVNQKYTLSDLKAILPETVECATTEGINWRVHVSWSTETAYNVKGTNYVFKGTLIEDNIFTGGENIVLEATIIVAPVSIENPVFPEVKADWKKGVTAAAADLAEIYLPTAGAVYVDEQTAVDYQIIWNADQVIHLGNAGETVDFTGEITYLDVPEWLTLPESKQVSCKVTVDTCKHPNTEVRNASTATIGAAGYTGDLYCMDCEVLIQSGEVIEALPNPVDGTGDSTGNPINGSENRGENEQAGALAVGTVVKVGKDIYKVTSADAANYSVEYKKTSNKASKIKIPDTIAVDGIVYKVTSISANAFKNNKKLTKVVIGNYVKTIGAKAFYGCKKLADIQIKSTKLKTVGKNAFKGIKANAKITVPKKKLSAYKKLLAKGGQAKTVKIRK